MGVNFILTCRGCGQEIDADEHCQTYREQLADVDAEFGDQGQDAVLAIMDEWEWYHDHPGSWQAQQWGW